MREYDLETGKSFNNIINRYAITEEELLSIAETVAKFVTITRITNIDNYLFEDKELTSPIIKIVVRCKDCVHFKRHVAVIQDNGCITHPHRFCALMCTEIEDDDYCHYGERRR